MSATSKVVERQSLLLADVAEIVSGYGFPKEMQGKVVGELPFFKVGDISAAWNSGQQKLTQAKHYLDGSEASAIKAKPFPQGTVVFAKIGEAIKLNRRAILGQPSIVDNNVMGLIPKEGMVDQNYLFYWSLMLRLGDISQATTVPSVRKSDVEQLSFPWVPIDQQKRIVAEIEKQFSRLDEAVANLKRVRANLKRYRAAVLKAAVEGRLDFVGRVVQSVEEWKFVRLADIGELISGQSPPSNTVNTEGIGTLYVTGPEQWDGRKLHLGKWTTSPKKIVPDGCFFITVKGAGVGKVFPGTACAIGRDIFAFKPSDSVSRKFVMHALIASVQDVLRHASGDIPGLSRSHILDHTILLPSREEQDRLVEELERHLSYANDLEAIAETSLRRADYLRQSILAMKFGSGSVRIGASKELLTRREYMEKRKLPGLPPPRKSEAEDYRKDLQAILRNYPDGISAEVLFQEAGYQGDQVDAFYRDLVRLADRIEQILPGCAETEWPMSDSIKVRLKV